MSEPEDIESNNNQVLMRPDLQKEAMYVYYA